MTMQPSLHSRQSTPTTVLITGATSGIGRHAALYLAEKGFHVIASGRSEQALQRLAEDARGLALDTLPLDVTDAASIDAAAARVDALTEGRGLDVLVNNAGWGLAAPMSEVTDADLRRQFDTNVFGLMAVTRAFLPAMLKRGAGKVINITSVGGRITMPLFGAYNATKYAIESMSDALRLELAPFGVNVVLVEPGVIQSDFSSRSRREVDAYAQPGSPFAALISRADAIQSQTDRMAVGPIVISRAIHRAIRSRRPRARYVAPFRYSILLALFGLLPTRLTDWAMRMSVGLTPKVLRGGQVKAEMLTAR